MARGYKRFAIKRQKTLSERAFVGIDGALASLAVADSLIRSTNAAATLPVSPRRMLRGSFTHYEHAMTKITDDHTMQAHFEQAGAIYPKVDAAHIDGMMARVQFDAHIIPGTTTTLVTAYIPLGKVNFTLCTEIMACVDPRNFNAELGRKYGIEKAAASARNKLWELEGYTLAKKYEAWHE